MAVERLKTCIDLEFQDGMRARVEVGWFLVFRSDYTHSFEID